MTDVKQEAADWLQESDLGPMTLADWVGPGKRYSTVEDMALDAMRWHDEAQALKMDLMKAQEETAIAREQASKAHRDAQRARQDLREDRTQRVLDLEMTLHAIRREVKFSPEGPFPRARVLALCNEQLVR